MGSRASGLKLTHAGGLFFHSAYDALFYRFHIIIHDIRTLRRWADEATNGGPSGAQPKI
jgi:hypothetical protein